MEPLASACGRAGVEERRALEQQVEDSGPTLDAKS